MCVIYCIIKVHCSLFIICIEFINRKIRAHGAKIKKKYQRIGGSFGMSLEGDCNEVEVTPNLQLLVSPGMSLEGVCDELCT
jgi:hypothetical protein